MDLDLRYYISVFLKRLPLFILVSLSLSMIGLTLAYMLPPVYRSQALLLVESPRIDVASTVNVSSNEVIQIIEQRLLTRANLLEIADDFNVFKSGSGLSPSDKVDQMRAVTQFRVMVLGQQRRGAESATAFTISFQHENPRTAASVTNQLVTLTLEENQDIRGTFVEQNRQFFEQEVERLDRKLSELEQQITAFSIQNSEALPDSLDARRDQFTREQDRLLELEEQRTALLRDRTQIQRFIENPAVLAAQAGAQKSREEVDLTRLEIQLETARKTFSDRHPKVVALLTEIETLQRVIAGTTSGTDEALSAEDFRISQLEQQMAQIDGFLASTDRKIAATEARIANLDTSIKATPQIAMTLNSLERDYEAAQLEYKFAQQNLSAASQSESIESQQKGERFEVIENAIVPERPESPNRMMIAGAGVAGGLGAGFALIILLELLNRKIQRPVELVKSLGIQPFGVVPYIETRREALRSRLKIAAVLVIVAAGIPSVLAYFHYQVMPLDLLVSKVTDKLGLDAFLNKLR
ncbi:MAG: Wzz/FepE/Etk N-terminal domain-containing protein [Pseudomonadota bacterium]